MASNPRDEGWDGAIAQRAFVEWAKLSSVGG